MSKLPDRYNPQESEKEWQKFWAGKENNKKTNEEPIYKWHNDKDKKDTFVIDTPPPTVSGVLHMGHIFSYTQADFIARYKRMKGFDVFYPMGFDDNGLPTERLVEKTIGKKAGAYEAENGRGSFVRECKKIVDEAEIEFENLFNTVALSVDWDQKYQTISPESQKISQASFVDLFKKGLVERKLEPVLWDWIDQTALSQADLVDQEKPSSMNDIEFQIDGSDEKIIIATTRPELLGACGAVMVHPEDAKYKHLIGKNAITALFGVKVPIIADEMVQMDKGTGAVMCCTFGDETDILWFKNHKLPLRVIINESGKIIADENKINGQISWIENKQFYNQLAGLNIKQARQKTLEILQERNLLIKSTEITHNVKCAERSGCPIEILVTPQWFIKIVDFKEQLKAKAAECNWYPNYMRVRIEQWIDGASWDWCISRQRYFGVPFPIWYSKRQGEEGKILVASFNQLPIDPQRDFPAGYSADEVTAETDIMDTWATSSISPQLSSKGISEDFCVDKQRHEKLFPADMRPQAHEIIRTWAFYTIVKALHHENKIPWKKLMISGWCLAADKTKMSKSKGNVITPQSLIEEKGADVVRYWASASNLGADIAYSEELFKIGGKLITKLFNASKFVSQNFADLTSQPNTSSQDIESGIINQKADLWILSRLNQTIQKAEAEFEQYEYAKARQAVEDFFWNDFCDNYLEIVKVRSYGLNAEKYKEANLSDLKKNEIVAGQQSGLFALYHCLEAVLKLFAPFIPHVTEELYQAIFPNKLTSIHQRGSWCKSSEHVVDDNALELGSLMLEVIFNIRKFKSDNNLSMKTPLKQFYINTKMDIFSIVVDLQNVCNTEEIITKFDGKEMMLVSEVQM